MFTVQQKAAIVAMYWKNGRSVVRTIREWRRAHGGAGCRDIPSKSNIWYILHLNLIVDKIFLIKITRVKCYTCSVPRLSFKIHPRL